MYHYEKLDDAIQNILEYMKVDAKLQDLSVPKAKTKYRKDKRGFQEILSIQERDEIAKIFAQEREDFYSDMEWK